MPDVSLSNVLLESDTNELEVMEFKIGDRCFGINVSKVLEIFRYTDLTPMPNTLPFIEGIFKPRDTILSVVNLPVYLNLEPAKDTSKDILIVTNFNNVSAAFHVNSVEGINRISWSDIEKPDTAIYGTQDGLATGIARYEDRLITILDFEKILAELNPETAIKIEAKSTKNRKNNATPIMIVEDSPILMRMITENLVKMGYTNITRCYNGQEAIDKLNSYKELGIPIEDSCAVVITDIEMPKINGHRLIKLIREDKSLKSLPCIIFSSLINTEMRLKGEEVGATKQFSKPEITKLIEAIDEYAY